MIPGYKNGNVINLRLWAAKSTDEFDLNFFQTGDYVRARGAAGQQRKHLQGALPFGDGHQGPGAAAEAGVFLCIGHLPGHHAPVQEKAGAVLPIPRPGGHSAQRHPSGGGHPGDDADTAGPGVSGVGRSLGHLRPVLRLHQPHGHARGPGKMAGRYVRPNSAPPLGDHLRNQPAAAGGGRGQIPRRPGQDSRPVNLRGRAGQADPDGQPGRGREPLDQRGQPDPHRHRQGARLPGLCRAVAGTVQQQNQRRFAPPLAPPSQSEPGPTDHRPDRRGLDHRPGTAQGLGAAGRGRGVSGPVGPSQAGGQGTAGRLHQEKDEHYRRRRLHVRRAGQADSRIQAPSAQRLAHCHPVQSPPLRGRRERPSPDDHPGRQGRSGL